VACLSYTGPKDWDACGEALTSCSSGKFCISEFPPDCVSHLGWVFLQDDVSASSPHLSAVFFVLCCRGSAHPVLWSFSEEIISYVVVYLLWEEQAQDLPTSPS